MNIFSSDNNFRNSLKFIEPVWDITTFATWKIVDVYKDEANFISAQAIPPKARNDFLLVQF